MAQVPDTSELQSVAPSTRGIDVEATPAESGALIGQGLEKFGAGAIDASKFYSQVSAQDALNTAQQRKDVLLYGDPNKTITLPDGTTQQDTGFFGLTGAAAMSARAETQKQLSDIDKDARSGLYTPDSQVIYDNESRRYRFQADDQISRHADEQQKVWALGTNETQATTALNMVGAHPDDPAIVSRSLNSVTQALIRNGQIKGDLDPAGAKLKAQQTVMQTQLRSLIMKDPQAAQKLYDASAGILGSLPDYDMLGRQVKEAYNNAVMAPAINYEIDSVRSSAHASVTGNLPGGISGSPVRTNLANVKEASGAFANPLTPVDGAILAANNVRSADYRGLTLAQIAGKWAPASDHNDPAAWAANVSRASGIGVNSVPNVDDPKQLSALLRGMASAEKSPGDQALFTPDVINQGVTESLAGKHANLGAPIAGSGQSYPSEADYINANRDTIEGQMQEHAEKLFPNYPDAQERYVVTGMRQLDRTVTQQRAQYEVDTHIVQSALASEHPPISEEQLRSMGPQVASSWDSMKYNTPAAAMQVERYFDANAKGVAKTFGKNVSGMLDRILAPTTDQNRITNPTQLWSEINPQAGENSVLTNKGSSVLSDIIAMRSAPGGEANATQLNTFLKNYHEQQAFSNETHGLRNEAGEERYNKNLLSILPAVTNGLKNGKTMTQMTDQKSPDYVGNLGAPIVSGTKKMDEIVNATMNFDSASPVAAKIVLDPTKSSSVDRAIASKQLTPEKGQQLKGLMLDVQLRRLTPQQARIKSQQMGIFPPDVPRPE